MARVNTGSRYMVFDKETNTIIEQGISTRAKARVLKRTLDYQRSAANQFRATPSPIVVYTDTDHPRGAGIYLH